MQKIKADQARKCKNITFYFNTRNLQHKYMRSPILVKLQAVLENGSTIPAGWHWYTGLGKNLFKLFIYV